ncbi:tail fiber domain-containing protein [Lacinutrix iliipiscaria]|uniref:Tail fiber domain-containing protein n=1 Tax=Lacinutrix iliipiscaria TaxID=1230532 RepID=A0ABW5WNW1_9FLAO
MKKILLILITFLFTSLSFSQSKGINYKALIKDNSNNVLSNQNITIEFSILEGPEISFTDVIYIETHMTTTDANGIVIVNIGEGVPLSGFEGGYSNIDWRGYFGSHFLKVQIDSGSGLTDMGTTEIKAVPYALYAEDSNYSGLENIDEGNGSGWRFIGMNPENYGLIANRSVDLSYSPVASTSHGATGEYATALGYQTTASGQKSFASGVSTIASSSQSTAMGAATIASGFNSVALGLSTRAEAPNTTAIGLYNVGGGDPLLASPTDPLFEIGNGNYVDGTNDNRTNALTVLRNGTITAPSFEISEITDNKALITKEFADANYSGGGGVSTGLEAIDESNGIGWRLLGRDPANYGNIGLNAVDFSYGLTDNYYGALGQLSFSSGYLTRALGESSFSAGSSTSALGYSSFAANSSTEANGNHSSAFGFFTQSDAYASFAIGGNNVGGGTIDSWVETDPLFEIGNSNQDGVQNRSNALTVLKNGTITAPSFDVSEIIDDKALITKEYADANYLGGGSGTNPTGLETLNEGNGFGWRLAGINPDNYGNIGENAVDLSISNSNADLYGATGEYAFSSGLTTIASGSYSTAMGAGTVASGNVSTAMGVGTIADDLHSTVVGRNNDNTVSTTTLFQVGNGARNSERSNAFTVLVDGTITAPSFDIAEITDPKALVTKEYVDTNSSIASGLEAINEGNGMGWRFVGRNPAYFGNIGQNAIDFSFSNNNSLVLGATGYGSLAVGISVEASGNYSFSQGGSTKASGLYAVALGYTTNASGSQSIAMGGFSSASASFSAALGRNTIADDINSTVVGTYNDNTTSTTTLFQVGNGTSSNRSNAFTVYQNGNAILAGALTQNSDRRLKKDIEDLNYGLDEVLNLNPVSYHWKRNPDQPKSLGLIAQDVQTVINEIVHTAEDETKTLSVSYTELIPVLIKAIQEQQEVIENQNEVISSQDKTNTEQTEILQALLIRVEILENKDKIDSNNSITKK